MSLADALNPHLAGNAPFGDAFPANDAGQSASIDQDEDMDDLFDEDAVVDHAERYSIPPPAPYYNLLIGPAWELSHRNASVSDSGQPDAVSDAEQRHREAMEYAEEEEPDQDIDNTLLEQRTEASALLPNVPSPKSSDGQVCTSLSYLCQVSIYTSQSWVIRMPNFVKVDSKPFHSDTYVGPDQEDEEPAGTENTRESSMSIKLKVENTLRWRWVKDEDGNYVSLHAPTLIPGYLQFSISTSSNANPTVVSSAGLMDRSVFSWEKSCLTFPSNCMRPSPMPVQLQAQVNHLSPRRSPRSTRNQQQQKIRASRISSLNTSAQKFSKVKLSLPDICN